MWRWVGVVGATVILACSGGASPDVDPAVGRWLLISLNGQTLPASGQVFFPPVRSARLTIFPDAFPVFQWCDTEGIHTDPLRYHAPDELWKVFPTFVAQDTITVSGHQLTWPYNNADTATDFPTDVLQFRRLAEGEGTDVVCAL
jgi:hypothetical protein